LSGTDLRRADLIRANLWRANLRGVDLSGADLSGTNLRGADLTEADLSGANLFGADLSGADLRRADLRRADLIRANLWRANLRGVDLRGTNLSGAYLFAANLTGADLTGASLRNASLREANLTNTIGLIKSMNVKPGDIYWKRFDNGLINFGYRFKIGLNELRPGEVFASDERVECSYPGFHFASREWCADCYPERTYEAMIRIPVDAKINEPWGTDRKASADKIEILQVFNTVTGEDVTDQFRPKS
jgi:hypothetical protein